VIPRRPRPVPGAGGRLPQLCPRARPAQRRRQDHLRGLLRHHTARL